MKQLLTILFVLSVLFAKSQAYIGSDGTIHPTGAFPVINSNEAKGTIKRAKSLADRNAIPVSLRDTGMLCWVSDSAKFYVLAGGIENFRWVDLITTGVVGGVAFERDPIFTNSPSFTITEQKKAYWDLVGLMLRADSVRSEIHDSIMVHQRPLINYDPTDFSVTNDTLHAIGKVNGESDPIFNNSVWGQLPDGKPEEWDAKVEQGALDDTAAAIRRSFKADTIYFDQRDFSNTGTKNDELRIKRYTNAQIDSLILANGGKIGDSSGVQFNLAGYYTKVQVDSIVAAFGGALQDGLIKPGYVTWSGAGYTYDVTGAVYVINSKPYKSSPGSITLDASDGALNRIDAIVVDTLGAIKRITGVAASNPVAPILDPSSQVLLTNVTVTAGSTGPNSLNTVVYNEEGFGEYIPTGQGVSANPSNTLFPFSGAKSLNVGGWVSGNTVTFTNSATASATSYTYIKLFIRLKSVVTDISSIALTFYNGSTPVSKMVSIVSYGINKKLVGVYQNVSVPMSVFGFTANSFNKIQIRFGGANADGVYIDYVQLQNSAVTETGSNALTDVYVQADSLFKTVGGNSFFVTKIGGTGGGSTVDTSFLRRDININTAAIATKEPVITAGTTSQFWRGDKTWQTVPIVDTQFLRRDININTANITTKLNLNFGTQGSVLFRGATGISQDNSHFFYDSLNSSLILTQNTPSSPLDIRASAVGDIIDYRNSNSSGYEGLNLIDNNAIIAGGVGHSNASAGQLASSTWLSARKYGEPVSLAINNNASNSLFMAAKLSIISPSGFVGINNLNPTEQLHVNGKLKIDTIPTGSTSDSVAVIRNGVIYKILQSTAGGGTGGATDTQYLRRDINTNTTAISDNMNPVWKRKGVVLTASTGNDAGNVYEPTIIVEGSPKILTTATTVFKMWYCSGWVTPSVNYAESLDGISWTKYSGNPIITSHCRNFVIKNGATYVMYAALNSSGDQIDRYTSTDGVAWTLANSSVISKGGAGTWNVTAVQNSFVFIEGGVWKMLIEGRGANGYSMGYYTSSDGITWTPSPSNPVLTGISSGGPYVTKVGSTYWMWCHGSGSAALLPTNIYRYSSPDLVTWTSSTGIVLPRREADEGGNIATGQVADAFLLPVANSVYLYYSASADGSAQSGAQKIKLAVADMPFSRLTTTSEGDNGSTGMATSSSSAALPSDISVNNVYATTKMGIGTTSPTQDLQVSKNVAGGVSMGVKNTSTAASALSQISLDNSTSQGALIKLGTGYTTYKTLIAGDMAIYNSTGGNIAILNDLVSGNINLAAGGSSTPHLTIKSNGGIAFPSTVTAAGTTTTQTINKTSGVVNIAAGATSVTVTNSLVSTSSIVLPVIRTNDATATIKNIVPISGSFTINLNAATTAETSIGFLVIN